MNSATYQEGHIYEDKRRPGLWYVMFRIGGKLKKRGLGRCGSEKNARKKAAPILAAVNDENTQTLEQGITMGELVKTYKSSNRFPARFSTAAAYTSYLDVQILPQWERKRIKEIKAKDVEAWLKESKLSGKTKSHLKGLMHLLFEYASFEDRWPYKNPIKDVRVHGTTKRVREPVNLTVKQFGELVENLHDPFRTMAVTAMCLGLRFSELTGLQWGDVDWIGSQVFIRRGIVNNRVDETKTQHSAKPVPVDAVLLEVWKQWRTQAEFKKESDWIFASPKMAGGKPYCHQTASRILKDACALPGIGWHSFRHSYRTLLDATGAPTGVQQRLMRHADVRTTMNVYGDAPTDVMRDANRKVVGMVLRTELRQ